MAAELTPRQSRFVAEYLTDLRISPAADRSGISAGTASRWLTLPHIQHAIRIETEARMKRLQMTADEVLAELARIGRANMMDYMAVGLDGAPRLDWSNLTRDQAAALAEVTVDEYTEGSGETARPVRKVRFKLHDKKQALEAIGKHLGLFTDRVKVEGEVKFMVVDYDPANRPQGALPAGMVIDYNPPEDPR